MKLLSTYEKDTMDITDSIIFGFPAVGSLLLVLAMVLMLLYLGYHSFQPPKYQHENSGKDVLSTAAPFALIWASVALVILVSGNVVVAALAMVVMSALAYAVLKKHARRVLREYSD